MLGAIYLFIQKKIKIMKNKILPILTELEREALASAPATKKVERRKSIDDVMPKDLIAFMKDNDIPENAYFVGEPNGYDGFTGELFLSWQVSVPTNDDDKENYVRCRFRVGAFRRVGKKLFDLGYSRKSVSTVHLKEFGRDSLYNAYKAGDVDKLEKYFSLYFSK
jgi:hypothetical protein